MLATAYCSNAISVTVPIVGSSIATAYAYRDFRRTGARAEHVSVALTVAGVFSTVAFAVVAATGALDRVGALRLGYRTAAGAFGWALVNWVADVACLVCAIKAVGEPVPWAAILVIWTAGVGAASFSPVPAGLGIVDIVLIAALATAGLHGKYAVAAALVYRSISLKVLITVAWLIYHHMAGRRREYAPEPAPPSRRSDAPLRHASAGMAARHQ